MPAWAQRSSTVGKCPGVLGKGGAHVEGDPLSRSYPAPDGAGDDIARRQFGIGVLAGHEAPALAIEHDGPRPAQGFGQQRQRLAGTIIGRQRRRVELDELQIPQSRPRPRRHGEAVAGVLRRVGGMEEDAADAAGRQHHMAGAMEDPAAIGVAGQNAVDTAVADDQIGGERLASSQ